MLRSRAVRTAPHWPKVEDRAPGRATRAAHAYGRAEVMARELPELRLVHGPRERRGGSAAPTIVHAVGARPNFVKMAPVIRALGRRGAFRQLVVHTGQHYDARLSAEIVHDVGLPVPDRHLGAGSGTHAEQTAAVLTAFERVLAAEEPHLVVVAGDVNSTLACALAASKLGVPVAHVEAGLRSWDWTMPEEINRVVTDRLSDTLFTHSPDANENLVAEGVPAGRIQYVGNTMIDTLRRCERAALRRAAWQAHGVRAGEYVLVTLHRPSNVDDPARLEAIADGLGRIGRRSPLLFPLHPRTRARLAEAGLLAGLRAQRVRCLPAQRYVDFLSLEAGAGAIVTDSGGVQEEASALGVPCYTLRESTERPITLTHGTNVLLGDDPAELAAVRASAAGRTPCAIPLWDGRAGVRVASALVANYAVASGAEAV